MIIFLIIKILGFQMFQVFQVCQELQISTNHKTFNISNSLIFKVMQANQLGPLLMTNLPICSLMDSVKISIKSPDFKISLKIFNIHIIRTLSHNTTGVKTQIKVDFLIKTPIKIKVILISVIMVVAQIIM